MFRASRSKAAPTVGSSAKSALVSTLLPPSDSHVPRFRDASPGRALMPKRGLLTLGGPSLRAMAMSHDAGIPVFRSVSTA